MDGMKEVKGEVGQGNEEMEGKGMKGENEWVEEDSVERRGRKEKRLTKKSYLVT